MDENRGEESPFSDLYLDDSFASIGNSTRSLLSPILNEKLYIRSSTPEKKTREYESEDEEVSYDPEKSKNMVLTSISLAKRSENISSRSNRTSGSSSSFRSTFTESSKSKDKGCQLSPWEGWLVEKTLQNREKAKERKMEESKKKREIIDKERQEEERQKVIEGKVTKWTEAKEINDKMRRERKKHETEEERRLKFEKQNEIEEKSKIVYQKWLEEKKAVDLEEKKKKEEQDREQKEREVEKRMKSEQAFEEWLKKSKRNSKGENCSFCYSQGQGLQGHYDWASYPAPNYINPMPWVHPVSKRNRERSRKKKEIQPASPPLLFRDIEQRKKKHLSKS